jgi:hypothetical protein
VLLLEEGWAQTTDLATGLARAGHHVTVLTASGGSASYRHRTVEWRCGPAVASPALLPYLDRMMAETPFDRVVPLTEAAMSRLWDADPVWAGRIYPDVTGWQRCLLRDKYALSEYLAACGVDVPRHRRLTRGDDLTAVAREIGLPLVLKGAIGVGGARVRIIETVAEFTREVQRAWSIGGDWGAQEFVEGPTVLFGGVFHDGRPLRVYAGDKVEQYPLRTGPAIRLRSCDDPGLLALGIRVIRELRWTGFASMDFIRRHDGGYVFLEVNPRLWGSAAAARAAGVDLFTPFAAMLAGVLPAPHLAFAANQDVRLFPRYLLSPDYRRLGGAVRAVRDLLGCRGWRHAGSVRHLVSRLQALHACHRRRRSL